MDQFKRILVSLDALSPTAEVCIDRALRLAEETRAELYVVDVLPETYPLVRKLFRESKNAEEIVLAERTSQLEKLCRPLTEAGLTFSCRVLRGRPFVEIITETSRMQCDLLMRDSPGDYLSGLEMRLLRNCQCPIWIVKGNFRPYFQRVLVAIDPLPEDETEKRLNRQILDLAASLARWGNATLFVTAIWQIRGEPLLVSRMDELTFAEHSKEIKESGRRHLEELLDGLSEQLPRDQIAYKKGDPAHEIRMSAGSVDADVIVMGTLARTGIPGLLMGNTAESVLRQTKRSVLALKPDRFKSPVLAASGDTSSGPSN